MREDTKTKGACVKRIMHLKISFQPQCMKEERVVEAISYFLPLSEIAFRPAALTSHESRRLLFKSVANYRAATPT